MLHKLAVASRRIKQNDEALRYLEEAAALGRTIEQKFGDSPETIESQCLVKSNLASLTLEITGDRVRSELELRDSVSLAQRLVEKYPYASAHHRILFDTASEMAEHLVQLKHYDEARNFALLAISEGRGLHTEFAASGYISKNWLTSITCLQPTASWLGTGMAKRSTQPIPSRHLLRIVPTFRWWRPA